MKLQLPYSKIHIYFKTLSTMKNTNFTPKVKTAYHQLIQDGEFVAARWLLQMLNTKRYIESLPMHLLNDSAWICAYYVDRGNNGYSFRIR